MQNPTDFRAFADGLAAAGADPLRESAARELVTRYSQRLVALARSRMSFRLQAKVAPEDVTQSVFRTFFRRLDAGEIELRDWAALWGFLSVTALRKCRRYADRYETARRDLAREVPLAPRGGDVGRECVVPDREPSPAEVAALLDELDVLLACLDEADRPVVEAVLAGQAVEAVALRKGCSERTVRRAVERARRRFLAQAESGRRTARRAESCVPAP